MSEQESKAGTTPRPRSENMRQKALSRIIGAIHEQLAAKPTKYVYLPQHQFATFCEVSNGLLDYQYNIKEHRVAIYAHEWIPQPGDMVRLTFAIYAELQVAFKMQRPQKGRKKGKPDAFKQKPTLLQIKTMEDITLQSGYYYAKALKAIAEFEKPSKDEQAIYEAELNKILLSLGGDIECQKSLSMLIEDTISFFSNLTQQVVIASGKRTADTLAMKFQQEQLGRRFYVESMIAYHLNNFIYTEPSIESLVDRDEGNQETAAPVAAAKKKVAKKKPATTLQTTDKLEQIRMEAAAGITDDVVPFLEEITEEQAKEFAKVMTATIFDITDLIFERATGRYSDITKVMEHHRLYTELLKQAAIFSTDEVVMNPHAAFYETDFLLHFESIANPVATFVCRKAGKEECHALQMEIAAIKQEADTFLLQYNEAVKNVIPIYSSIEDLMEIHITQQGQEGDGQIAMKDRLLYKQMKDAIMAMVEEGQKAINKFLEEWEAPYKAFMALREKQSRLKQDLYNKEHATYYIENNFLFVSTDQFLRSHDLSKITDEDLKLLTNEEWRLVELLLVAQGLDVNLIFSGDSNRQRTEQEGEALNCIFAILKSLKSLATDGEDDSNNEFSQLALFISLVARPRDEEGEPEPFDVNASYERAKYLYEELPLSTAIQVFRFFFPLL